MMTKVHKWFPHILFVALAALTVSPSLKTTQPYYAFLVALVLIELVLLAKRKDDKARTIGIIVYFILLLWEIITSKIGIKNAMLYPAPENVFNVFVNDRDKIIEGIFSSLRLLLASFGMVLLFGVLLGLFVGLSDRLSGIILPIVRVVSPIPPIIYSPYAVALLPSFRAASIFIVTLTIFWSIFMSMVLSVREIDPKIMDSAKTLNLRKGSLIVHVMLPYSLPGIINSVSVSVSTSFLVLTAAEMLGGTSGLGWFIKYYSDFADFDRVMAGIIVIGLVVTLLNRVISFARKLLIKWR